jgi:hypothetical protein
MNLTEKFIKGLQDYNLSLNDIKGWKYVGGNKGRHLNYFKLIFGENSIDEMPIVEEYCVCGHKIKENCYISKGDQLLVLGNCCIKKFIPKSSRTCELCEHPHKNRKVNRCNDCRRGVCDECGTRCNENYKTCYNCYTS